MACLKYLKWLFIPVFAILLMSHNAFAFDLTENVSVVHSGFRSKLETSRWASGSCSTSPAAGVWVDQLSCVGSLTIYDMRISIPNRTYNSGEYIMVELINSFSNNSQSLHSVWFGASYTGSNPIELISQEFENMDTNNGLVRLYFRVYGEFTDSNILIGGTNGSWGLITINSGANGSTDAVLRPATTTIFSVRGETDYSSALNDIRNNLPSASDIGDAVNEPEEQASENISNQSADDYEMESASMSSLFSQFGGFISAVNGASIGDCNIPANFNHIDLGILNLCANPVPDYVQVAVSIVSCMLIAPYLMNIIKRILSIADKIREV